MFIRGKILVLILLLLSGSLPNCTVNHDRILQKQLFDLNWKFSLGDYKMAEVAGINDTHWRSIDLPHNWSTDSVLNDFLKKAGSETLSKETGWYKKNFEIPENWVGKRIVIEFEGISAQYEVFVNGVSVNRSVNRNLNTIADITTILNPKGNNLIIIRVDAIKESEIAMKTETGILGHVWLVINDTSDFKE